MSKIRFIKHKVANFLFCLLQPTKFFAATKQLSNAEDNISSVIIVLQSAQSWTTFLSFENCGTLPKKNVYTCSF